MNCIRNQVLGEICLGKYALTKDSVSVTSTGLIQLEITEAAKITGAVMKLHYYVSVEEVMVEWYNGKC